MIPTQWANLPEACIASWGRLPHQWFGKRHPYVIKLNFVSTDWLSPFPAWLSAVQHAKGNFQPKSMDNKFLNPSLQENTADKALSNSTWGRYLTSSEDLCSWMSRFSNCCCPMLVTCQVRSEPLLVYLVAKRPNSKLCCIQSWTSAYTIKLASASISASRLKLQWCNLLLGFWDNGLATSNVILRSLLLLCRTSRIARRSWSPVERRGWAPLQMRSVWMRSI